MMRSIKIPLSNSLNKALIIEDNKVQIMHNGVSFKSLNIKSYLYGAYIGCKLFENENFIIVFSKLMVFYKTNINDFRIISISVMVNYDNDCEAILNLNEKSKFLLISKSRLIVLKYKDYEIFNKKNLIINANNDYGIYDDSIELLNDKFLIIFKNKLVIFDNLNENIILEFYINSKIYGNYIRIINIGKYNIIVTIFENIELWYYCNRNWITLAQS